MKIFLSFLLLILSMTAIADAPVVNAPGSTPPAAATAGDDAAAAASLQA